jgi:hypothetical protein
MYTKIKKYFLKKDTSWLELFLRSSLGSVFFISTMTKALDPNKFIIVVTKLNVLPTDYTPLLCYALIILEGMLASTLMFRYLYLGGLYLTSAVCAMFIWCIYSANAQGTFQTCGCLGPLSSSNPWIAIGKNIIFIGMVIFLVKKELNKHKVEVK